jgi:hypothetical protein
VCLRADQVQAEDDGESHGGASAVFTPGQIAERSKWILDSRLVFVVFEEREDQKRIA